MAKRRSQVSPQKKNKKGVSQHPSFGHWLLIICFSIHSGMWVLLLALCRLNKKEADKENLVGWKEKHFFQLKFLAESVLGQRRFSVWKHSSCPSLMRMSSYLRCCVRLWHMPNICRGPQGCKKHFWKCPLASLFALKLWQIISVPGGS